MWRPTFCHPTVLVHHGWAVEADVQQERQLQKKSPRGKKTLGEEEPEEGKKFYCACMTVCLPLPASWRCSGFPRDVEGSEEQPMHPHSDLWCKLVVHKPPKPDRKGGFSV